MAQRNQRVGAESQDRPSIDLHCQFLRQFDAETLRLCGYGIVPAGGNFDYSHNLAAALSAIC
jgi:hypothetical protein